MSAALAEALAWPEAPVPAMAEAPLPTMPDPPVLARVQIDPAAVERDMVRLVLTLVEFLRRLMEAQAIRRMETGALSDAQVETLGDTLGQAQATVLSLCGRFGIAPQSLNLDLGPLGSLF